MAYVAISTHFVQRVESKIQYMMDVELKTLGDEPNKGFDLDDEDIAKAVWGEHYALKALMPVEWCYMTINQRIRVPIIGDKAINTEITGTQQTKAPPDSRWVYKEIDGTAPVFAELVGWWARKVEILERWTAVRVKVVGFLNECKSLNEAIKLWPDVAIYVHKPDLDRLGIRKERVKESRALEALRSLDTDSLVGAAVIARMSGANV